jgi:hypothetical protein
MCGKFGSGRENEKGADKLRARASKRCCYICLGQRPTAEATLLLILIGRLILLAALILFLLDYACLAGLLL